MESEQKDTRDPVEWLVGWVEKAGGVHTAEADFQDQLRQFLEELVTGTRQEARLRYALLTEDLAQQIADNLEPLIARTSLVLAEAVRSGRPAGPRELAEADYLLGLSADLEETHPEPIRPALSDPPAGPYRALERLYEAFADMPIWPDEDPTLDPDRDPLPPRFAAKVVRGELSVPEARRRWAHSLKPEGQRAKERAQAMEAARLSLEAWREVFRG